jgi:hypothetical protein
MEGVMGVPSGHESPGTVIKMSDENSHCDSLHNSDIDIIVSQRYRCPHSWFLEAVIERKGCHSFDVLAERQQQACYMYINI